MGVRFDLVNWSNTGANFPSVYARLQQFSVSLEIYDNQVPQIACPTICMFVNEAAFMAGAVPLTTLSTGHLVATLPFPIPDENGLRQALDPILLAVIEQLPGYVLGSGVIVVDPPAPPPPPV